MDHEIYEEEGLLDESTNDNVASPSPESTVSNESATTESLTLAEIEQITGKKFPTKEAALKSLKDTTSHVGTKKEKLKEEILSELGDRFIPADRYNEDMFYAKNEQFSGLKDVINAMAKANGMTPQQVVETDGFKRVYESVSGYEQIQKQKTVLSSSPRIAASSDNLSKALKAKIEGNNEIAEKLAVKAVRDALEL